jgi:hypothetical protein
LDLSDDESGSRDWKFDGSRQKQVDDPDDEMRTEDVDVGESMRWMQGWA